MSTTEIVERIIALRELTEATGTKTTKTVNDLLQSLDGPQLLEVATELKRRDWRKESPMARVLRGQR